MNEHNDTDIAAIRKRHDAAERGPASAVIGAHHDRGALLAEIQRCEAERAQLADEVAVLLERSTKADLAREEERKAWARFVGATIDYTQAQMVWAAGPVAEIVPFCEGALKSLDEATEALAVIGVDVVAYLEAGE